MRGEQHRLLVAAVAIGEQAAKAADTVTGKAPAPASAGLWFSPTSSSRFLRLGSQAKHVSKIQGEVVSSSSTILAILEAVLTAAPLPSPASNGPCR